MDDSPADAAEVMTEQRALAQLPVVLALFFEYAATLGLTVVRYTAPVGARSDYADRWGGDFMPSLSRYDGLLAVRLTPLGRLCIG